MLHVSQKKAGPRSCDKWSVQCLDVNDGCLIILFKRWSSSSETHSLYSSVAQVGLRRSPGVGPNTSVAPNTSEILLTDDDMGSFPQVC